jgi:sugar phosphate permease
VLGSLIFGLCLSRQLPQVLHQGVGIDLADGADLLLVFVFAFVLAFAFAKQAAGNVADGSEPAFTLQACLVLHLILALVFGLVLEFCFELVFEFRQGFQFTFICHDESSCEKWSNPCEPE